MDWNDADFPSRRRETHYEGRVVSCFAERPDSLWAMIRDAARRNPQGEALVCGQGRWTRADLIRDASVCRRGFLRKVRSRAIGSSQAPAGRWEQILTLPDRYNFLARFCAAMANRVTLSA
jgi:long-chain acyl-CoA synthetase